MNATDHGRQLARHLAGIVSVKPRVERSKVGAHTVDVLVCDGAPQAGVTTLATVSLSDANARIDGQEQEFGIEIVLSGSNSAPDLLGIIVDAAVQYLRGDEIYPGAVFPDLVPTGHLKHLFFVSPFLWDSALKSVAVGDKEVRFLQAIPISDEEMALAGTEGSEALDDLFERSQIDIYDWSRDSVASL